MRSKRMSAKEYKASKETPKSKAKTTKKETK